MHTVTGKFGIINKGWYTKENSTIMVAIKTLQGYYS